jgi:hypothetical protein
MLDSDFIVSNRMDVETMQILQMVQNEMSKTLNPNDARKNFVAGNGFDFEDVE